ncbi:MAG: FlgD immunoglobulin-like domain containing protein, partial [Candidatus Thorarchaeota archaeon]
ETYDYAVFDEGYSFNGWILRIWPRDYWSMMNERWGTVLTFDDFDLDGLPDNDPSLAIDEVRFGSNHQMVDTETDGLNDLEEFSAGYRGSTDPIDSDTDGDDIPDPEDVYPLDSVETVLKPVAMVIDGVLDSLSAPYLTTFGDDDAQDLTVDLYASYSHEGLYLCFDVVDDTINLENAGLYGAKWYDGIWLNLDADLDGYWGHGDDNYAVYVLPQGGPPDPIVRVDVTLDDRTLVADTMPNTDLVASYSLTEKGYCIEILVRANSLFRISTNVGDSIRMQCRVLDYDEWLGWQYSFPRYQAFTEYLGFEFGPDVTDVDENTSATLPGDFELLPNYPNPFNPQTTFGFVLPARSDVAAEVINLLGQRVRTLFERSMPAGRHTVTWDGLDDTGNPVASGVYFYRVRAGERVAARKMLLLK